MDNSTRTSRRGFKLALSLGAAGALILSVVSAVPASALTVGSPCTKIGASSKAGKVAVVCKQAGSKKVWTDTKVYTVEVAANAILGGKNNQTASWIVNYVIPTFTLNQAALGKQVSVKFTPKGIDDNAFKTQLALDLAAKKGPDVLSLDGFWVAEFADAGYVKPLNEVVAKKTVDAWDGWSQIPTSVQGVMKYNDKVYGIPAGTDGRIIYFNKALFTQAGLPTNWQPTSWADILTAAKTLKTKLPDVQAFQINANTGMGEATAMQGFLNFLAGAGSLIYDTKTKKWQGNTKAVRDMLTFYNNVYNVDKTGNSDWNLLAGEAGRNASFEAFSKGKLAMMIEGDYAWRGVLNPVTGNYKMADRDTNVGFAKIPAQTAKSGVNGQSFVSYSGGSGYTINPYSQEKNTAWDLLTFMNGRDAALANMSIGGAVRITQRKDVNAVTLMSDPCLKFVFENAIPNTFFRPAEVNYNAVSTLLQKATGDIVSGKTVAQAAADYETALKALVGADKVVSN
jgi:multiple sugar transport system substrate-binding protein